MDIKLIWDKLNKMGCTDKKAKIELSEMILKLAVIENHKREMAAIPSEEELSKMYTLSPEFELRMRKLINSYLH